jgi:hypothetical protein
MLHSRYHFILAMKANRKCTCAPNTKTNCRQVDCNNPRSERDTKCLAITRTARSCSVDYLTGLVLALVGTHAALKGTQSHKGHAAAAGPPPLLKSTEFPSLRIISFKSMCLIYAKTFSENKLHPHEIWYP